MESHGVPIGGLSAWSRSVFVPEIHCARDPPPTLIPPSSNVRDARLHDPQTGSTLGNYQREKRDLSFYMHGHILDNIVKFLSFLLT